MFYYYTYFNIYSFTYLLYTFNIKNRKFMLKLARICYNLKTSNGENIVVMCFFNLKYGSRGDPLSRALY